MNKCGFNSFKNPCIFLIKGCCTSPVICKYKMADDIDKDKEIARLTAENDKLQKRLDNAVGLPCKIGDEVYEVHGKCDGENCPYNGDYGQWRCSYGGKSNCNSFITVNKFCYSDIPRVGKTIFVTKKAAEARLAELKGGRV